MDDINRKDLKHNSSDSGGESADGNNNNNKSGKCRHRSDREGSTYILSTTWFHV